jgi:hypothetical protein
MDGLVSKAVKQRSSADRGRNRAALALGVLFVVWISTSWPVWFRGESSIKDSFHVPKLSVDLRNADRAELELLPNVGDNTSKQWVDFRQADGFVVPVDSEALQSLPQVGPKRAAQLAPFLLPEKASNFHRPLEAVSKIELDFMIREGEAPAEQN